MTMHSIYILQHVRMYVCTMYVCAYKRMYEKAHGFLYYTIEYLRSLPITARIQISMHYVYTNAYMYTWAHKHARTNARSRHLFWSRARARKRLHEPRQGVGRRCGYSEFRWVMSSLDHIYKYDFGIFTLVLLVARVYWKSVYTPIYPT